jgi:hypothetical protein
MAIVVNVRNIQVGRPQQVTLRDHSGAHTELTLLVESLPPIGTAFDYHAGEFNAPMALPAGQYHCRLFVQAYHYTANKTLTPAYDVECLVDGQWCANAKGALKPGNSDAGAGDFVLTVV